MAQTDTRTLQEIKRDTEQARAGLTDTVDQLRSTVSETASDLRQRISPKAIKAEVNDYFRSRGEELLDTVTSAARRNPMQAVAVGASVAYPLLRLAKSVPFPILMVGAGLFLASSKTGQAATQRATDAGSDLADEVGRQARSVKRGFDDTVSAAKDYGADKVSELASAVAAQTVGFKEHAASVGSGLSATADNVRRQATAVSDTITAAASEGRERSVAAASSMAESAVDIATGAAATVRDSLGRSVDAAQDTVGVVRQRTVEFSNQAGRTFLSAVEQNPLVVAGIGVLIGGLIASALPRSDLEDGLVGDASGKVRSQVRDAASKGMAAAKDTASGVYDDVARGAEEQGLTAERLGAVATDLGQRVRKVAETAVATALEPQNSSSQKVNGETGHG